MEARKFVVHNQTRETTLSSSVAAVNAALEPLKVLKVLIEGLPANARTGLWLTNFKGVPVARTLSPFDLIYLDKENRVLHGVELSKDGEFAPFRGRPASALVLPSQSLKSSQTREGDQIELRALATEAPVGGDVAVGPAVAEGPLPAQPAEPAIAAMEETIAELAPSAQFFSPLPAELTQIPVEEKPPLKALEERPAPAADIPNVPTEAPSQAAHFEPSAQAKEPSLPPATAQDFFTPAPRRTPPPQDLPIPTAMRGEVIESPTSAPDAPPSSETGLQISQPSAGAAKAKRRAPEPLPIQEAPAPAESPRTYGPPRKQKFSWKVRLLRWLFPHLVIEEEEGPVDRRRADRQSLPGLVAYFFTGGSPEPQKIANISVTGFYLQTDERWMPGTVVRMTLQRLGTKGDDPADTITVNSRIVRWGSDGEGFEFILTDLDE